MTTNMTYLERLKAPRWQRKRLEIMQRDNFTCQSCLATDVHLHVHHSYYIKDREPWNYPDGTLHTLCENCHQIIQAIDADEFSQWEWLLEILYTDLRLPIRDDGLPADTMLEELLCALDGARCSLGREHTIQLWEQFCKSLRTVEKQEKLKIREQLKAQDACSHAYPNDQT